MAINIQTEQILTFSEAANRLPRRRRGRKVHPATLARWATAGSKGVRLETLWTPGGRVTSLEALQRFFDRLTPSDEAVGPSAHHGPRADRVESELVAEGL